MNIVILSTIKTTDFLSWMEHVIFQQDLIGIKKKEKSTRKLSDYWFGLLATIFKFKETHY